MKVGAGSTKSSDVDIDDCITMNYQTRNGVPGFEIETKEDAFWSPIAHRTISRKKSNI